MATEKRLPKPGSTGCLGALASAEHLSYDYALAFVTERCMNSLLESEFPLHETQGLRYELLKALTDTDLAYKLAGDNPTLGELCREIGDIEHSYIQSFKTFKLDWSYRNTDPELATSVARLQAWYTALDHEFESVIRAFSEQDLNHKQVDRGHGFTPSVSVQFQIFHEAVLMFYAKASVYLKALHKTVNDQWQAGVG